VGYGRKETEKVGKAGFWVSFSSIVLYIKILYGYRKNGAFIHFNPHYFQMFAS